MKNTMEYKGYVGSIEFSESDGVFFGKVQGIRSLISYEGANETELIADFHAMVDKYLELCDKDGLAPEDVCGISNIDNAIDSAEAEIQAGGELLDAKTVLGELRKKYFE